jgi:hypothetical protein
VKYFSGALKDTATAATNIWSFDTRPPASLGKCFNDPTKVLGVVATNALTYSLDPVFSTGGRINYSVSSLHFDVDGMTPNYGYYRMQLNSSVARCYYGFTNAPVMATISVLDVDGNSKTSTTSFREANGSLYFTAADFTYSAPTVRIVLTQPKTITCVKVSNKKVLKKVTGTSPKCPAGYVKR